MRPLLLLLSFFILFACTPRQGMDEAQQGDTLTLHHATLLRIVASDSFTTVSIADPWHEGQTLHRYVLIPKTQRLPHTLPQGTIVRTPLAHTTIYSSVHAALLNDFRKVSRISGMCDMEYIVDAPLKKALQQQNVRSIGSSMQPNIEAIIQSKSDALLVSSFKDNSYGPLEKLGIPIIECADYMETSALGRAEWMRFFGRLFGFGEEADSAFARIEMRYDSIANTAKQAQRRPRLMVDKRENGVWYVPGGKSTLAQLFKDAGFDYVFADNADKGSIAVSFEEMIEKCAKADMWLIKYGTQSYLNDKSLLNDDERYSHFLPFDNKQIYGCNTLVAPYYERTPFHPDVLLEELVHLGHPDLPRSSKKAQPTFFKSLWE